MSEIVTVQGLIDAAVDAQSLEDVVNGAVSPGEVTTRLGTQLKTLARLQSEMAGQAGYVVLETAEDLRSYTRGSGVTFVLLLGFYIIGDEFGGAIMYYDAGSVASDDDLDVVVGADDARWIRWKTNSYPARFVPLDPQARYDVVEDTVDWALNNSGVLTNALTGNRTVVWIPTEPGSRLLGIRVRARIEAATDDFETTVVYGNGITATLTDLQAPVGPDTGTLGTEQNVDLLLATPHTMLENRRYFVDLTLSGAGSGSRYFTNLWALMTRP